MVPSMQKNMKSSTSPVSTCEPGFLARTRASHQPTAKATRYMIPYQWTLSGPKLPKRSNLECDLVEAGVLEHGRVV